MSAPELDGRERVRVIASGIHDDDLIAAGLRRAEWFREDLAYKAPEVLGDAGREFQAALPWIVTVLSGGDQDETLRPLALAIAKVLVG